MTDLDHEAAERTARGSTYQNPATNNLARCYQASRAREARLAALVRKLGKCPVCEGVGRQDIGHIDKPPKFIRCSNCAGTGLVEAVRKELKDA